MKKVVLSVALASSLLTACGGPANYRNVSDEELNAYIQEIGGNERYRDHYRGILSQGDRNAVINLHHLAMSAFANKDFDVAAFALDAAIEYIETVYANDPTAKKARSKFHKEETKDFKGEPYERAMVFLYRGLLYLKENEFENARAMFESGLLQDSLAEDMEYTHDYTSLEFLSGWASSCNGDQELAIESFSNAMNLNENIVIPEEKHNYLVYQELGIGPKKVGDGEYGENLKFEHQLSPEQLEITSMTYMLDENVIDTYLMEDLYWQATTRGGRQVDSINEGKAVFKENTENLANSMIDVASAASYASLLTDNSDMANLGAASAVVGLVSMFMSNKAKPAADLRSIYTPGKLFIGTGYSASLNENECSLNI